MVVSVWWAVIGGAVSAQTPDESTPQESQTPPPSSQDQFPDNPVTRPFRELAPSDVQSIFESTDPEAEIASVYLDGRAVFEVAAPSDAGALSAIARAHEIERRLEYIAKEFVEPHRLNELNVSSRIDDQSNQPIISVNDEILMTVTYLDARLNGVNNLPLRAVQLVNDVEDALRRYSEERQPEHLWQQLRWMMATLLITVLGSFAIAHFHEKISRSRQALEEPPKAGKTADTDGITLPTNANRIRTTLLTRQKISSLTVQQQSLRFLQILLWLASGFLILGYFPYTRWLQTFGISVLRLPLRFILIALIAYGLIRFSGMWIDRLFLAFQNHTVATIERSQRLVLRLSTFSRVIKGIAAFVIGSIAVLIILSMLGVQITPLLAGAGLLGFAVSFASQSLIKDIINGFLVLLEDQYGVGDVITIKGLSGFVENMNLRITQLRATDGQLITIPNGQIDIVQNLSKEWSQVDLRIPVGLTADINNALRLVEAVANDMQKDQIWSPLILEPPLLLGVDELSHAGAIIRIWIKTLPLKQWDVAREYRRRLKIAFEDANIPVGAPQQVVYVSNAPAAHLGAIQPYDASVSHSLSEDSGASERSTPQF